MNILLIFNILLMIKADIYVKLTGVTTTERPDGLYDVDAPTILYTNEEKTEEVARVPFRFEKLQLEELDLPSIYGRIMAKFNNSSIV